MMRLFLLLTILLACQTEDKNVPVPPALQKTSSSSETNSFEDFKKKDEGCELEEKQEEIIVQKNPEEFKLQGNEPGCEVN